jgi:aryl-alcohol dehydrogenase-like predicted oxidoreductase
MQTRSIGSLEASVVGLGCNNFGGRIDEAASKKVVDAALDSGITLFDTADIYGGTRSEEFLGRALSGRRDRALIATKFGGPIDDERKGGASATYIPRACDDSLRRLGTDRIDLYQLHNPRIDPILADDLWETLIALKQEGKVLELGVALGPAIGWVEEGVRSIDDRPIVSLQTVFNALEQEPGRTFAQRPRVQHGEVSLISRVPHASDSLSGKANPDTVFPKGDHRAHRNRENMLDNFEKAETLGFLWTAETGRTMGQAAIAGILANPRFASVLPTVLSVAEVREYARASDLPLSADEVGELADLQARNFDHVDRYKMAMKSSV